MEEVLPRTLGDYVRAVLKEKDLTHGQVSRRSDDKIDISYISKIVSNRAGNLSVERLEALARGLGVDAVELFKAAIGTASQLPEPATDKRLLKVEFYFSQLPDDKQDDALLFLRVLASKHGRKKPRRKLKLTRSLSRRRIA